MNYYGNAGMGFAGLFAMLAVLLLVAGVVVMVIWLIRASGGPASGGQSGSRPPGSPNPPESPLDILARRFASGEISAEDYQKARDLLRESPKP
ncbi:MAG: SHOCT domain-containing protein [Candidatus Dormiibacterota bacterium]